MCLLTYFPKGIQPNCDALEIGAINNPHGSGWAIVAGDRIIIGRAMDADKAIAEFAKARKTHSDGPALFHSRIATAGSVNTYNVHPFPVNGDKRTVVAHNGILPGKAQPGKGDKRSDTHLFAAEYLAQGRFGHLYSRRGRKHLQQWLGSGNKLVVLSTDPRLPRGIILNEGLGSWNEGVWYSNDSYQSWYGHWYDSGSYATSRRRYTTQGGKVVFSGGANGDGRWRDYVNGDSCGIQRLPDECVFGCPGRSTLTVMDVEVCMTCRACQDCGKHVGIGLSQEHHDTCEAFRSPTVRYITESGNCNACDKAALWTLGDITYCATCRACQGCGGNVRVGYAAAHANNCPRVTADKAIGYEPNRTCNTCHVVGRIAATMICSQCRACQDCGMHEVDCLCWTPHSARNDEGEVTLFGPHVP